MQPCNPVFRKFLIYSDRKKIFTKVFVKRKVEELSFTYFHSKLVYINQSDGKLGQTFLKIENFWWCGQV